ncbi:hypothetical protein SANT12839_004210 [Streptomyces antimycoticus]|uniref:Uncharacterized protein n=1 Tax=Streptomyces antimycoticus TaxID=68175 RepID=A0A4D4JZR7_9ACTN|nr:hypothetical protein SANT12839_004210 [Streptomyces antimycoticus]
MTTLIVGSGSTGGAWATDRRRRGGTVVVIYRTRPRSGTLAEGTWWRRERLDVTAARGLRPGTGRVRARAARTNDAHGAGQRIRQGKLASEQQLAGLTVLRVSLVHGPADPAPVGGLCFIARCAHALVAGPRCSRPATTGPLRPWWTTW